MPAKFHQGDLIFLKDPIPLPDGKTLDHPVLIISSNIANAYENSYTGVMMTSSTKTDKFSFQVDDLMFESPLDKRGCQLRLYIIVGFKESDIRVFKNRMKPPFLQAVLKQIRDAVFS